MFSEYHDKHQKYPKRWEDIGEKEFVKRLPTFKSDYNEGFRIDDSATMTFYEDYKDRKVWYRYIIDESGENSILIHSENNNGKQDWVSDNKTAWWYFADKKTEMNELKKREKIIKKKKLLFIFSNEKKRINAIREISNIYNPQVFDILLNTFRDKSESIEFRRIILGSILELPNLYRFKKYTSCIKKLISEEKRALPLQRYKFEAMDLIKGLNELLTKVQGIGVETK